MNEYDTCMIHVSIRGVAIRTDLQTPARVTIADFGLTV